MRRLAGLSLALGMLAGAPAAHAQDAWPSRAITLVVPYAAGGYTDLVGRLVARHLEKSLGRPVIVENRTGAGGRIGTRAVAQAAPDGYTFCVCSTGAVSVAPPDENIGYDPLKDLATIGVVSSIPQVVIVKADRPEKTMAELLARLKANPGKLSFGSAGNGSLMHYAVELFKMQTGTDATHVPYKGGAPAIVAVMAGEVDFSFQNMTDALPQVQAGKVRALAVTSEKRSPYLPDAPSINESVLPGFVAESWNGIMAPPKTPDAIIRRVSSLLQELADSPEMQTAMKNAGATTVKTTPEEFTAQLQREIALWRPLLKQMSEKTAK